MKILYYTNDNVTFSEIEEILSEKHDVKRITTRPTQNLLINAGGGFDLLVSDRSRFIIPREVVEILNGMACNLHPSFLPFNRGDQPLLWAAVEGTPFGVTIHSVNERFDEGQIVSQTKFNLPDSFTLRTAYSAVRSHMVGLFKSSWESGVLCESLRNPKLLIPNDVANGSTKSRANGRAAVAKLPYGWDTEIYYLRSHAEFFLNLCSENNE
jgi:hypothetical protein